MRLLMTIMIAMFSTGGAQAASITCNFTELCKGSDACAAADVSLTLEIADDYASGQMRVSGSDVPSVDGQDIAMTAFNTQGLSFYAGYASPGSYHLFTYLGTGSGRYTVHHALDTAEITALTYSGSCGYN